MTILGIDPATKQLNWPKGSPYLLRLKFTDGAGFADLTGRVLRFAAFQRTGAVVFDEAFTIAGDTATILFPGSVSEVPAFNGARWQVAQVFEEGPTPLFRGSIDVTPAASDQGPGAGAPASDLLTWAPATQTLLISSIGAPGPSLSEELGMTPQELIAEYVTGPVDEKLAEADVIIAGKVLEVDDAITELGQFTSESSAEIDDKLTGVDTFVAAKGVVIDAAVGGANTARDAANTGAQNANAKAALAQTVVDAGASILAAVPIAVEARDAAALSAAKAERQVAPLRVWFDAGGVPIAGSYYNRTTGAIAISASFHRLAPMSVQPGDQIRLTTDVGTANIALVVYLDSAGGWHSSVNNGTSGSTVSYVNEPLTVPAGAFTALVCSYYINANREPVAQVFGVPPTDLNAVKADAAKAKAATDALAVWYEPGAAAITGQLYNRTTGVLTPSADFRSLDPIDVTPGETVYVTADVGTGSMALAVFRKADGSWLSSYLNGSSGVNTPYTREPVIVPALAAKMLSTSRYAFAGKSPKVERFGVDSGLATAPAGVRAATARLSRAELASTIRKILTSAQRPLGNIAAVLSVPPTIAGPSADGAVSPINSSSTTIVGGGRFNAENRAHVSLIGGRELEATGRIKTITRDAGMFLQGHGAGIGFYTMAADIAICMRAGPTRQYIACVTDTLTGERGRVSATDIAPAIEGYNYQRLMFASRKLRWVEAYGHSQGAFRGIDVPIGDSIWPAVAPEPQVGVLWDSWGFGLINDTTRMLKLGVVDWFLASVGIRNAFVNGITGTGVIANSGSGQNYNPYGPRATADFTVAKVGYLDMVYAPGSINDNTPSSGGVAIATDDSAGIAATTEQYRLTIGTLMTLQPKAIIIGGPQQFTSAGPADAGRAAAYKAGFAAAAGSDARMIWLENSMYLTAPDTSVVGADGSHPAGSDGARYIGDRLAQQVLLALQSLLQTLTA